MLDSNSNSDSSNGGIMSMDQHGKYEPIETKSEFLTPPNTPNGVDVKTMDFTPKIEVNNKTYAEKKPNARALNRRTLSESETGLVGEIDPWDLPEIDSSGPSWSDLSSEEKVKAVIFGILKPIALLTLLYLFICSLDFLSSAFRLLGGKAAGEALSNNQLIQNPITGLMIGILATVLVQSSSTSSSIVVSMVAAQILPIQPAIYIIMGANIGTSMTNTIVAMAHAQQSEEFRRAFGGATVHDMFNWMAVIVLLPIERLTGYLFLLTEAIVDSMHLSSKKGEKVEILKVITKPFTSIIVQIDKKKINAIALDVNNTLQIDTLLKKCDGKKASIVVNETISTVMNATKVVESPKSCWYLFSDTGLSDAVIGIILLVLSLVMLITVLILIVKLLHSILKGHVVKITRKVINADFPGIFSYFTGYVAILFGAGMTILVQSSSIFTSALTPLVGIGALKLERMYPLTLGANIGTTVTGVLAALASSSSARDLKLALQIAFCHLFFNISGILLFYPVPFMRKIPIGLAKMLGNTTAKYRWFAGLYIIIMFFFLPIMVFGLSIISVYLALTAFVCLILTIAFVFFINLLQKKRPNWLPTILKTWDFLPSWMHSLKSWDRAIKRLLSFICCEGRCGRKSKEIKLREELAKKLPIFKPPVAIKGQMYGIEPNTPMTCATKQNSSINVTFANQAYCTASNSTLGSNLNSSLYLNMNGRKTPDDK